MMNKNKPKVLYIENHEGNQFLVKLVLEKKGYDIFLANNAKGGIKQACDIRPHLILMDLQLPDISGFEATDILRSIPGLKEVPIIAITAHAMSSDREKCRLAGFDSFISKPINTKTFESDIAKFIKRES
jgi:two-component system, cell cycle response regulator DivK